MSRPIQLATILETVADAVPDRTAVITNHAEATYTQLDQRATRLANHLASQGVGIGDHVAIHSRNRMEWVEAFFACFKIRAVPINVNYRYVEAELRHVYGDSECVAVICEPGYTDAIEAIRGDLPRLHHQLVIGEEYENALAAASGERNFDERSSDDVYLIYTGGTTGMPKGVVWRHEDITISALNVGRQDAPIESVEALGSEAAEQETAARIMACGPMMHGGTQWALGNAIVSGGVMILYSDPRFDPISVLDLMERSEANSVTFMGDAMSRPVAEARLAEPDRWSLPNLVAVVNAAAGLSQGVRAQIREAFPGTFVMDNYGASETGSTGRRFDDGEAVSAPRFECNADTTVLDEETGRRCEVGEVGKLASTGHIPLGYWKDPEKTAATFPTFDGRRWVIPGDFAQIEPDGSITVLGRGSVCINSGGEKIHPEEVEAVLKEHAAVFDAAVVGTPSDRWGEQVTAIVRLRDDVAASIEDLRSHCRSHVADYKVPKDVVLVETVPRTEVGKVDYRAASALALDLLGIAD